MPEKHSRIVGGSTAKRVMNCPGSVALCSQVPPRPSSSYAEEGTLLHMAVATCIDYDIAAHQVMGKVTHAGRDVTEELIESKLAPALRLFDDYLDEVDAKGEAEIATEQEVNYGKFIPEVFGSCDVIARAGDRAICLDWKFGSGVMVDAADNYQLLFYAAAARRTKATKWAFDGATEVELVIIQPPYIRRWLTTHDRLDRFEQELKLAVERASSPDAPLKEGDHCRWCAAKPICPLMQGAVERALTVDLRDADIQRMGRALHQADLLEQWIGDLRALAHQALKAGVDVPGWKLVEKRATRKWKADAKEVEQALYAMGINHPKDVYKSPELLSPAQMEKVLKKHGLDLPDDLVEKVSAGTTIAPETDARPAVTAGQSLGQQLIEALGRL